MAKKGTQQGDSAYILFILHSFLFGVSSEYLADKMFVEIVNMFVKLLFALVDAHIVHTNMTESLFCLL